jgi:beta-lactamase superfamily II metal-dependent hydrolase
LGVSKDIKMSNRIRLRSIATAAIVFLSLTVLAVRPAAAQVQAMAVLAGAVANFTETVTQSAVQAFCIDLGKHTPEVGNTFREFSGDVRLTFANGTSRDLPFKEAGAYIGVEGTGGYSSLRLVRKDATLRKVEFTTPSLAHPGTDASDFQRAQSFVSHLATQNLKDLSPRDIQQHIWRDFAFGRRTEQTATGPVVYFDYLRRDPQKTLSQTVVDLKGRGDSIVIRTPAGRSFMIDTGQDAAARDRIAAELNGGTHGVVLLTHADFDHIGNAQPLLQAHAGDPTALLFNTFDATSVAARDLLDYAATGVGAPENLAGTSLRVFQKAGEEPLKLTRRTLSEGMGGAASPIAAYDLALEDGVQVQLWQLRDPKTRNQSSIVTRVTHNGYSTVYLADADPTVLGELARVDDLQDDANDAVIDEIVGSFENRLTPEQRQQIKAREVFLRSLGGHTSDMPAEPDFHTMAVTDVVLGSPLLAHEVATAVDSRVEALSMHQIDLHCDFLKWPHHAALPTSNAQRAKIAAFLEAADPQVVILSTDDPALRGQDIDDVRDFIHEVLPEATIKVTGRDGTIKVLTEKEVPGMDRGYAEPVESALAA